MNTPTLMRRRRPVRRWMTLEGSLVALLALVLATVAWFNDPHSLGRLGLAIGAWSIVGWLAWRSVQAGRRGS